MMEAATTAPRICYTMMEVVIAAKRDKSKPKSRLALNALKRDFTMMEHAINVPKESMNTMVLATPALNRSLINIKINAMNAPKESTSTKDSAITAPKTSLSMMVVVTNAKESNSSMMVAAITALKAKFSLKKNAEFAVIKTISMRVLAISARPLNSSTRVNAITNAHHRPQTHTKIENAIYALSTNTKSKSMMLILELL